MSSLTPNKRIWRSLAELEGRPEFQEFLEKEFPEQAKQFAASPVSRRRFMQLMGASLALSGVAGCRWEEDHIVPLSRRPENYTPGLTKEYATSMELGGVAAGLLATSYDGRPIKLEPNAGHPGAGIGTSTYAQASILGIYDPDRSKAATRKDGPAPTRKEVKALLEAMAADSGAALRILAPASSSKTLAYLRTQLLNKFNQAKWVEFESVARDNERLGLRQVYTRLPAKAEAAPAEGAPAEGAPAGGADAAAQPPTDRAAGDLRSHLNLAQASVVVSFDADLVGDHPDALRHAAGLAVARDPDRGEGGRHADVARIYAIESVFSTTGAMADHRLAVRPSQLSGLVAELEAKLTRQAASATAERKDKFLSSVAAALLDARKRGRPTAVAVGYRQPPEVHAAVARINHALGNVGRTVSYTEISAEQQPASFGALADLAKEMQAGTVKNLIVLGGNPVYDAPGDVDFAAALAKVGTSVHLGLYQDETAAVCKWHVPQTHYLEEWGDARTYDGTLTMRQPLIDPLYKECWSAADLVKALVGERGSNQELVKNSALNENNEIFGGDKHWRLALERGFVENSAAERAAVGVPAQTGALQASAVTDKALSSVTNGELEVVFAPSSSTYDGRFANNAWLQELPDFMTKLCWDNAAVVAPQTAKVAGVEDHDLATLTVDGKSLELPIYVLPGVAPGTVHVSLGYGRTRAGQVGGHEDNEEPRIVGVDVSTLRTVANPWTASKATLKATGKKYQLASTQNHWAIDAIGRSETEKRAGILVVEAGQDEYHQPGFETIVPEIEEVRPLINPKTALSEEGKKVTPWKEHSYDGYKWGMSIDLSKCIGCNACVVACQAENNIPVVGKQEVINNREMHWIRVDRYFVGDATDPSVAYQPVACQQCENAPCEQVCPVGATVHSDEGLNDMSYNRCVGTRYCMNNCPYKVRRFNYFYNWKKLDEPKNQVRRLQFNPDVTVRSRGVMEKCTFCVQRIQNSKIAARNEREKLPTDSFTTACAAACPTNAISFGDLNDDKAQVAKEHGKKRAYAMVPELNTKPRTAYLARITNVDRGLKPKKEAGHGGNDHE